MSERFLTKEEELQCGEKIQRMLKAQEQLKEQQDLPAHEKSRLHRVIAAGEKAVEELTAANTALVWSRASAFKKSYSGSPDLEDIVQEGMIGLMKAAHRFDPKRGNKFSTVAYHWIMQSIIRGVNSTNRAVRLPENRVSDLIKMNRIRDELKEQDLSEEEIKAIIQQRLGLTEEYYTSIMNASGTMLSLNQKVGDTEEDSRELLDHIGEINHEDSAEQDYLNNVMTELITQQLQRMPKREQEVVTSYYKLDLVRQPHKTPREVKEEYGLTNSKYNRILNNCIKDIKQDLLQKGFTIRDFE